MLSVELYKAKYSTTNMAMSCLDLQQLNEQLQNVQAKIIELQQKKAEEHVELESKQTMIEPNMMVFRDWLESIEMKKKEYELQMKNKEYELYPNSSAKVRMNKGIYNEWGHIQSQKQHISQSQKVIGERYKHCKHGLDRMFDKRYPLSERSGNEYTIALEKHEKDKSLMIEQEKMEKILSQNVELFQTKQPQKPDMPSEFMIKFIESTYNMFIIQQKRIEQLETKISLIMLSCPGNAVAPPPTDQAPGQTSKQRRSPRSRMNVNHTSGH